MSKKKYGSHNIPSNVKNFLKNKCQIPKKWKNVFIRTGSASLAKNTWAKYTSAYNTFFRFCKEEKVKNPWPISKNSTVCFILWCKKVLNLKAGSIQSYLSALQTISKFLGLKSQKVIKDTAKLLVRGIQRSEKQVAFKPTDPLTFKILIAIKEILKKKNWKPQGKKVVWACICVGYFGSFRASELLTKTAHAFDPSSTCSWADIIFKTKSKMSIRVKNPKTMAGKSEMIDLFAFPDKHFCPIRAMKKLKKSAKKAGFFQQNLPIFRFESGKCLTISNLSDIVKKLLKKSKFKNLKISAKSLRSGIPSDLENYPDLFNDLHIKIWGRWKSNAYQRYMKDDQYQREWIFQNICKVLTPFCV